MDDPTQMLAYQQFLINFKQQRFWTQVCAVSAMTIVLYDYLITLPEEIKFMWKKDRWSVGKALFFAIRYYTLAMIVFNTSFMTTDGVSQQLLFVKITRVSEHAHWFHYRCSAWINWHWVSAIISTIMSQVVLMLRIYVMFTKSKRILIVLLLCFTSTFATTCTIAAKIMLAEEITIHPFPGVDASFCVALNLPSWFYAYWIPFLIFETLMFLLVLAKGYLTFRSRIRKGLLGDQSLLECLIHDSVLYFFVIFAAYLVNLLIWVIAGIGFIEIPIGFALALASVLSQRMFLNMRNTVDLPAQAIKRPSQDYLTRYNTANVIYIRRHPGTIPLDAISIRDELRAM